MVPFSRQKEIPNNAPHSKRVLPALILAVCGMTMLGNTRSAFSQEAANTQTAKAASSVSSGNNQFAFDLFKNVASAQKDANVFFSPVSISMALAMTYAGSEGQTRKQMAQVLHLTGSQQDVASGFQSLMASMSQPADAAYQLKIANALWGQEGEHFQPEFVSLMHTYYSGDFDTLDFAKTPESLATINHWVAEKTADKIPQLLHPGDIDKRTRLVLTNAVYFKACGPRPSPKAGPIQRRLLPAMELRSKSR
jgi:serpin B